MLELTLQNRKLTTLVSRISTLVARIFTCVCRISTRVSRIFTCVSRIVTRVSQIITLVSRIFLNITVMILSLLTQDESVRHNPISYNSVVSPTRLWDSVNSSIFEKLKPLRMYWCWLLKRNYKSVCLTAPLTFIFVLFLSNAHEASFLMGMTQKVKRFNRSNAMLHVDVMNFPAMVRQLK